MTSKRFAKADRRRCVSCGACENECPKDAIKVWRGCYAVVNEARCIGCGKCARICPAECIEIRPMEDGKCAK